MSRSGSRLLWALFAAGTVVKLVLAFGWVGQPYDQNSFALVRAGLSVDWLSVYADIGVAHWPYPPLYLSWIAASGGLADLTGAPFHGFVNVPCILADVGIAWIVQAWLGRRGADERTRLLAAGLVALGPAFVAVSGYHGQLDAVAILPAVAALVIWEGGGERRALIAGAVLGIGIATKTFPVLLLLALLPGARSWKEGVTLVAAAAALPVVLLFPFLVHDSAALLEALDYPSLGQAGGIGLIESAVPNPITGTIVEHASVWNATWVLGLAAFLFRTRPPAPTAAVIVWLTVWVFGSGFYLSYLLWGLPFLLLAGRVRAAAAVQLIVLVPLVIAYGELFDTVLARRAFDLPMVALWGCFAIALALLGRDVVVRAHRDGTLDHQPQQAI